jgi:hypothetical protein
VREALFLLPLAEAEVGGKGRHEYDSCASCGSCGSTSQRRPRPSCPSHTQKYLRPLNLCRHTDSGRGKQHLEGVQKRSEEQEREERSKSGRTR